MSTSTDLYSPIERDHGMIDDAERAIGGVAVFRRYHDDPADDRVELLVFALRDGRTFGAMPRGTWYSTIEEARAAAPRKLDQQRKRYAQKYAAD